VQPLFWPGLKHSHPSLSHADQTQSSPHACFPAQVPCAVQDAIAPGSLQFQTLLWHADQVQSLRQVSTPRQEP